MIKDPVHFSTGHMGRRRKFVSGIAHGSEVEPGICSSSSGICIFMSGYTGNHLLELCLEFPLKQWKSKHAEGTLVITYLLHSTKKTEVGKKNE